MCKACVEAGEMTQEELDEANAKPKGTDPNQDGAAAYLAFGPDLEGAPDPVRKALEKLFGKPKDPEVEALEEMDNQIKTILEFYREQMAMAVSAAGATESGPSLIDTPRGLQAVAEAMAGTVMFKQHPSAIAYTLAILLHRYVQLLDQWAELYVTAATDSEIPLDLDAATTAESKTAVTEVAAKKKAAHEGTGMYL